MNSPVDSPVDSRVNAGVSRRVDARVPEGPVAQSLRLAVGAMALALASLALWWATSNIRAVPPERQAVTLRFGRIVGATGSGLVLAWPPPFERVVLLPGPQRPLEQRIAAAPGGDAFLTGDGGAVLLDASLTYRVADPAAFLLAGDHVAAALPRLFRASAVAVAAGRGIDDFLAVHAGEGAREALRSKLAAELNRRLRGLAARGASLGIEVTRVDLAAALPPAAKQAFDAVLEATQRSDQMLALARTDAARTAQRAAQDRDRVLTEAHAAADERVAAARTHVAQIAALAEQSDPASRPSLIDQVFRERLAAVLRQAGSVDGVDPNGTGHLLLPAAKP